MMVYVQRSISSLFLKEIQIICIAVHQWVRYKECICSKTYNEAFDVIFKKKVQVTYMAVENVYVRLTMLSFFIYD